MGIGIAYPRDKFELRDASIVRVADQKKWIHPKNGYIKSSLLFVLSLFRFILSRFSWYKNLFESSDATISSYKNNRQIMLHLQEIAGKQNFVVATYHMPCEFKKPRVMTTHMTLAAQAVQSFGMFELEDMTFYPLTKHSTSPRFTDYLVWRFQCQAKYISV